MAEPATLVKKKCCRCMPLNPATAGTTWETPGSHLENKSVRLALFSKKPLERRTQLCGSSEMRHSVDKTESPFLRPSSYHRVSPAMQATRTIHQATSNRTPPEAASAPAPTSIGESSSGKPTRSSRPHSTSTVYGWLVKRLRRDFMGLTFARYSTQLPFSSSC